MELGFQIVTRKGAGQFRVLAFDRMKRLHFPLTVFAAEAVKRSSDSTARVYLNAVIPFFEWLHFQQITLMLDGDNAGRHAGAPNRRPSRHQAGRPGCRDSAR